MNKASIWLTPPTPVHKSTPEDFLFHIFSFLLFFSKFFYTFFFYPLRHDQNNETSFDPPNSAKLKEFLDSIFFGGGSFDCINNRYAANSKS